MSIARSFYNTAVYTEHYLGMRWPVAIWRSVLEQAIKDIVEGPAAYELRDCPDLREKEKLQLEIRAAAEHWVEDDGEEPRRFRWVCLQLGLDPSAVRRSIEERKTT